MKNEKDQPASILQSSPSDSAIFHVTTDGSYAVLDTGASRSVIGSELVPSLLKDLPDHVRTRVREVPSNVGFRFGNNQVLHSQSQIQVPLSSSGKKTWLIIEIVPGATPFLLSIRAMKFLGAQIDLGNNEVYLKNLSKSLSIHENRNGLLTLRLRDLCMKKCDHTCGDDGHTIYHSQHLDSSDQEASQSVDPSCVSSHAESSRHDSDHQDDFRASDGESQGSSFPVGDTGRGAFDATTSSGREVPAVEWTVDGSPATEEPNRGDCPNSTQSEPSSINASNTIVGNRFGSGMGDGFKCNISTDRTTTSADCYTNDSSTSDAKASKSCDTRDDNSHGTNSVIFTNSDASTSKSDADSSSRAECSQHHSFGSDVTQSGVVGTKVHQLGKEMERDSISRSVRTGSGVCGLDFCPGVNPDHSDDGLLHVLPDSRTDGAGLVEESSQCLVDQDFCHLLLASFVSSPWEEQLLRASLKDIKKKNPIDLLEVYASEDSRLTKAVQDLGGKSLRFTKQDGDLSTFAGRVRLLRLVFEYSPRHIWLAPECLPWCAWNQFNQCRSIHQWERVHNIQEESRPHLRLCNLLMKIQRENNRHCHIENPAGSGLWKQPEIQESLQSTLPAKFDQCQMGLKHPQNHRLIRKRTIVHSTSKNVHELLDDHLCSGQHVHAPIAGSCKFDGRRMLVSRFAAFYPTGLAKRIAKGIMQKNHQHVDFPVYPVETLDDESIERPQKRSRTEEPMEPEANRPDQLPRAGSNSPPKGGFLNRMVKKRHLKDKSPIDKSDDVESGNNPWLAVFQQLKQQLPRVGAKEFRADSTIFQDVQTLNPKMNICQVVACKGVEKYLKGDINNPHRHTVVMKRFSNEIVDLGCEAWASLSQTQQRRKAIPSHIMVCMFGSLREVVSSSPAPAVPSAVSEQEPIPHAESTAEGQRNVKEGVDIETLQPWTPAPVSQSGPKFNALSSEDKSIIRKLHHNLGHPAAETLSRHLAFQGSRQELIDGAKDFQCSACMERRPPKKGSPGELKPAREFNEVVGIDGFEWSNQYGVKVYVLHAFDEGTHFHLGRRTTRDGVITQKCLSEFWLSWAGSPNRLYFDAAGEFLAEAWKNFLQKENIAHKLTAESWQRGRVERHGGIIKEMLSRMNQQVPIRSEIDFDQCLLECFKAKNSLSNHEGFSPEQAVLGKASKLPASVISDETTSAHMLADSSHPEGEQFRKALSRRTAARESFLRCENSSALRRALLRQSKGEIINWHTGQLCMYWSKRNAPNMLEKGRWMGPAQVVLQESRSIVWVSHVNRLLRCARENLRPVSLKEFQDLKIAQQSIDQEMLANRARELERQLKERSGVFQFRDLSDLEVSPDDPPAPAVDESGASQSGQPEEEPLRRESVGHGQFPPVHEIPVPGDSDDLFDEQPLGTDSEYMPTTPSFQSDNEQTPEAAVENSGETIAEPVNNVGVIYNATLIEPALDKGDCIVEDDSSFWGEKDTQKENFCAFEFSAPLQQIRKYRNHPEESIILLANAAKKSHAEVSYRNLNPEERKLFDVAKRKELTCWLDTNTVKAILKSRVHPERIMGSRWVLTWKTCDISSTGYKAKARLVVKGFQDPEVGQVQTDSPTLSRDARMILLQTVASQHWTLQNFDIKTAFLRGKGDGRELAMQPVPELKELMGLKDDQVCLLEGNAYGRVDAPLLFYKELRSQLEKLNFECHPLDNCLFLLRNPQNPKQLDGILGTHVDDGIGGGNARYDQALEQLQKVLPFGSRESGRFRFTGLDIEQLPDFSIRISQEEYIHKIQPIDVPKGRRAQKDALATATEIQSLRALCGSLQYAAVHSRPDIATKVAYLQKSIPNAKVADLMEGNKVLKESKEFATTSLMVRPLPFHELTFASFGDASFASESNLRAQQGLFIMACLPTLAKNQTSDFSPIAWSTKQIGRVVRSTLSAEAYAMSSSVDKLNWIRCMWGYIQDPRFQWQHPEQALKELPKALLITDCKSLFDLMTKVAVPNCQEWRTTIEVMLIKQLAEENADGRWISTAIMLADCLTKPMDSGFLRNVLRLGRFRIFDEQKSLQENANRKFSNRWLSHTSADSKEKSISVNPIMNQ